MHTLMPANEHLNASKCTLSASKLNTLMPANAYLNASPGGTVCYYSTVAATVLDNTHILIVMYYIHYSGTV